MALVSLTDLMKDAEAGNYAVGAFNVSSFDQLEAVIEAAEEVSSPVIVMALAGVHCYSSDESWWKNMRQRVERVSDVDICLHLDHGLLEDDCYRAIDSGFTSVMIDASRDVETGKQSDFDVNISRTRTVADYAHKHGVSVEGEIGTVGGGGEGATARAATDIALTDVEEATEFAARTGVDALAVGVGTSHGSVKFPPGHIPHLAMDVIADIHRAIPQTYLVLHGSSSISADDVATINANHGKLADSTGIMDEEKVEAIANGIRKINQGTDSHLAWTAATRQYMAQHPADVDPYLYLKPGYEAMKAIVKRRLKLFGSAK